MRYKYVMKQKNIDKNKLMKTASHASMATATVLIILKLVTFLITGSMAILSSLFDSIQDAMTSTVNLIAIRHATEPADKEHSFGHGKAHALGGVSQAFIIAIASLFLLKESIHRLFEPQEITQIGLGIGITVFALVLTLILIRFQKYVIRKTGSLSIKADMAHYTGDILMNVGVIISIIVSYYLGWTCVDALFGIGVAVYLLVVVYQITIESFKMLMDTEMPSAFRKKITEIILGFPQVIELHDLKTRQSGDCIFIQFCIHMHKDLTLEQAHDITDQIELAIIHKVPDAQVIIHFEPHLHEENIA
ncbi:MAG: cation diffusion facilitator family transporter [Alphaproteobacteria bacterium]|nr:cation diffusion facilitator family transporter [Alphaproteobacteria bacterium]